MLHQKALILKETLFWAKCLFPEDADPSNGSLNVESVTKLRMNVISVVVDM